MTGGALLALGAASVALLLALVIWAKMPAFVALLIVAFTTAIAAGIPLGDAVDVVTGGIGGTLGSVVVVVGLGAMLGRIIEVSGGADSVAMYFTLRFGKHRVAAAVTAAAFILGIPVFFDVGFIILAPIIFGFARTAGFHPLKIGLPVAATLLTIHVALPPHPGPVATADILGAELGTVLAFGIPLAAVTVTIGYFLAKFLPTSGIELMESPAMEAPEEVPNPPAPWVVMGLILLPIVQILVGTAGVILTAEGSELHSVVGFLGSAPVALLTAVLVAWGVIGHHRGWGLEQGSTILDSSLPSVAIIIFVTGAGGGFAGVLTESGIGQVLSDSLTRAHMPLILTAYLLSLALRAAQGSASVAMLTTAGLLAAPIAGSSVGAVSTALLCLAIGFGALGLSHVNDSGFWIVTRYLGLSVKDGLRSWTLLSTVFSVVGFLLTAAVYSVV